ncbi:MAG TPA: restriction endonuclease subunit S [Puia sp.]|nr:restriction endonuclease subunit S [Puia sp.]
MELEKEYKKTEMGLIPDDWSIKEFADVMDGFTSGQTPYRGVPSYFKGNIPWITSGELNYNVITDTNEKITEDGRKEANLKMIPKGTFLFAITGLEAAGTRGSCAITGIEATTNQSCMALYPKKGLLITPYLYHYYVKYGNELALKYCQGTKQQSYTGSIAKKLPIIVPPTIGEQTAIATALSDTDALINSLNMLIAKKRSIKQGAMEVLFTPQKNWSVKKLSELGKVYGGLSGKSKSDFENGLFPYIPFMNIMNNPIIDLRSLDFVNIKKGEYQNKVLKGDLFFNGSSETPEEVGMCSVITQDYPNLYLNSFCFGYRLNKDSNTHGLFLAYFFRSPRGRSLFFAMAQGATRYNLSKANFNKIEIYLPSKSEQLTISETLLDLDMEIRNLESKLSKYRQIKTGMMQTLLTGQIRLV